jgi:hypothetical protein
MLLHYFCVVVDMGRLVAGFTGMWRSDDVTVA